LLTLNKFINNEKGKKRKRKELEVNSI